MTSAVALVAATEDVPPTPLTPSEHAHARRLRNEQDRADYLAAHGAVRRCVGALVGVSPDRVNLTHLCPGCGSAEHGRPWAVVRDGPVVPVSLSHARGVVAAAAGWQDVGIDVEHMARRQPSGPLLDAALGPTERERLAAAADPAAEFVGIWVRKEALIKVGALRLDALATADLDRGASTTTWRGWTLTDLSGPGFVAATASRVPVRLLRPRPEGLRRPQVVGG